MEMLIQRIELIRGDITQIKVDAIVNAANASLMGGGGVDGAIHRVGGPSILAACKTIIAKQGSCKTGDAVITLAGNLPAKYVIHTVGPIYQIGTAQIAQQLASCYEKSLLLATANTCETIAFPNISTGIYGYPKAAAAVIAIATVKAYLANHDLPKKVVFVCYDEENFKLYKELIP